MNYTKEEYETYRKVQRCMDIADAQDKVYYYFCENEWDLTAFAEKFDYDELVTEYYKTASKVPNNPNEAWRAAIKTYMGEAGINPSGKTQIYEVYFEIELSICGKKIVASSYKEAKDKMLNDFKILRENLDLDNKFDKVYKSYMSIRNTATKGWATYSSDDLGEESNKDDD